VRFCYGLLIERFCNLITFFLNAKSEKLGASRVWLPSGVRACRDLYETGRSCCLNFPKKAKDFQTSAEVKVQM